MIYAFLGLSIAIGLGNFVMLCIIFQRLDTPTRRRHVR